MTRYLMGADGESERLAHKTEPVLLRRHLDWAGLRAGESFLDVGCGSGEVAIAAAELTAGGRVVALDADADRLAFVAQASRSAGLGDLELHRASIDAPGSTGLPDDAFDHAWARFVVEYHPRPVALVREMARVVRPGGRVTLIDVEGNGTWHFGMPDDLRDRLHAVLADVATTGFDPGAGARLPEYALAAGLVDIRHEIEPYHRIVGAADPNTLDKWRRKLQVLGAGYRQHFPDRADPQELFDELLDFLAAPDTMTWSLLHLVQGRRRERS